MSFTLASKGRNLLRRVRGRLGPKAVILLYHRVADTDADPYLLCVSPAHFEEHMQVIRNVGYPMRLQELARRARERRLPHRTIGVTFDDGYQDNHYVARPLMERHDVPGTVFMTTGRVGRDREFWWDELERIFLTPGPLPARLEVHVGGGTRAWDLGEAAKLGESELRRGRGWTVVDPDTPTLRHAAFQAVYDLMRGMSGSARARTLDDLLRWAGSPLIVRPSHRALEPEEVVDLEQSGIVDVGAHTVDHPALSEQPVEVQREEIRRSKAELEAWLGHAVPGFAYPYGLYSDDSVAEVERAGFDYGCTCDGTAVRWDSGNFVLPRVDATNVDGDVLERQLQRFFRL